MIDIDRIISAGKSVVYSEDVRARFSEIESKMVEEMNRDFLAMGWKTTRKPRTDLVFGEYIDYIYALIDPLTKEICYICKTNNPPSRHAQHVHKPGNWTGNMGKSIWIDSLKQMGKEPIMYVLDCCHMLSKGGLGKQASKLEKQHTQQLWADGHILLNRKGLPGGRSHTEWRERVNNSKWADERRGNGGMLDRWMGVE